MKTGIKFRSILLIVTICLMVASCNKQIQTASEGRAPGILEDQGHLKQTKTFSADVAIRWLNMQLEMLRVPLAPGAVSQASERCLAYCGIALYESVVPGMPAYQSLGGQLNQLPGLPATEPGKAYHWAASANAALAYMNRQLFPSASAANITAMNNLENELQAVYAGETDATTLQRSIDFGRAVSAAVYNWANTDGTLPPTGYVLPVGPGLWEKTPPNFAGPVNPFAANRRRMVAGSDENALQPPPVYSTDPGSEFYASAKDVYDRSLTLTPGQISAALYHRDAPGYPGGGSLVAMLAQIFQTASCNLDVAALAYAKTGIGSYEAITICFTQKYAVNLLRPITYIRTTLGHPDWSPLFPTPGHPEFPAAHATNGGMLWVMLTDVFGENFGFTFHHYDYLGLAPHTYASFEALAHEMSDSRPLAGIHYQSSCDKGLIMGKKIASNILSKIKFLKD